MLAAVAAPQHIRQHRQAAPLHQATCSTTTGQPRYVTESACCASAFPELVTTLCEAALLRRYTFLLPTVHDAKQLPDFLGNTHSGVVVNTCHRCRCAPDRPAKSGHECAQTLVSKRVESPDIGRPVGMQQAPLEGEQSSQDLQEASKIHGELICLCCLFTLWTRLASLWQAVAWDLTALTSHGL